MPCLHLAAALSACEKPQPFTCKMRAVKFHVAEGCYALRKSFWASSCCRDGEMAGQKEHPAVVFIAGLAVYYSSRVGLGVCVLWLSGGPKLLTHMHIHALGWESSVEWQIKSITNLRPKDQDGFQLHFCILCLMECYTQLLPPADSPALELSERSSGCWGKAWCYFGAFIFTNFQFQFCLESCFEWEKGKNK